MTEASELQDLVALLKEQAEGIAHGYDDLATLAGELQQATAERPGPAVPSFAAILWAEHERQQAEARAAQTFHGFDGIPCPGQPRIAATDTENHKELKS